MVSKEMQAAADAIREAGMFSGSDVDVAQMRAMMAETALPLPEGASRSDFEREGIGLCHIGVPDARWQERPLLLIVPAPSSHVSEADIRAHLAPRVAKWWLPERIEFVESLPKNGVGKVMKADLRQRYSKPGVGQTTGINAD